MLNLLRPLIVKQLKYDLTPVAGLALVGHYLRAVQSVFGRLDAALPVRGGVANSDILRSVSGKPTAFFPADLSIRTMPSSKRNEEHRTWKQVAVSAVIRAASGGA